MDGMSMSGMSMSMATSSKTHSSITGLSSTTSSSAKPSYTTMMNMGEMENNTSSTGVMMSSNGCKIKMLWNWETIDACFLSETWKIKSHGGFAGLCIGVILLVVFLEALRRAAKVYDQHLDAQHKKSIAMAMVHDEKTSDRSGGQADNSSSLMAAKSQSLLDAPSHEPFRPNVWQQAVRALLHTLHFAVAYWIMLLAMYYNGFVIICIIIGAFIGAFVFQWERIGGGQDKGPSTAGLSHDATGCCG